MDTTQTNHTSHAQATSYAQAASHAQATSYAQAASHALATHLGNLNVPDTIQPGLVQDIDKRDFENQVEDIDDYNSDPDYVPDVAELGSDTDAEDSNADEDSNAGEDSNADEDDYKNDPDYVPDVAELGSDTDSDSTDSDGTEDDSTEDEEAYESQAYASQVYVSQTYASQVQEPPKIFGCHGCNYEFKDGWKQGWKAAMKFVEAQVRLSTHAPEPPACDNCGIACKSKCCGGTCGGKVRYCSKKCQSIHWSATHKYACMKK